MSDRTRDRFRQMVPCPECDNGRVYATFTYTNGDTTDVAAECPYCGGAGTVLAAFGSRDDLAASAGNPSPNNGADDA